jgi:hypothetical protein
MMHHQILSKRDGRNLRYSCDGQIFIWDYIHQDRYKIKPKIDVKKVKSAYKGNERCTIQA